MSDVKLIFVPLMVSLLLSVVAGFPAMWLAGKFGLIDNPGSAPHKQHARPTPLAGGISIALTLLATSFVFRNQITTEVGTILMFAAIILAFGLWDDSAGLSASKKFTGQILAAVIAYSMGIRILVFSSLEILYPWPSFLKEALNFSVTIFWLVGITNAFNLIDSMDGLVAGLSSVSFAFFMFASFQSQQLALSTWATIMLGISVGLYLWNANPARFFLGDAGAQTLGFILAAMAILYTPLNRLQSSSWFVPILLVAVPIFDTSLVVFSRLRRRLNVFKGGHDHTYHRLTMLGLEPNRAVLAIHLSALLLDIIAFVALSLEPIPANGIFLLCIMVGLLILFLLDHYTHPFLPVHSSLGSKTEV